MGTKYSISKHEKTTGKKVQDNYVSFDKSQLQYSASGIGIHPEFLPYFFGVDAGCPQKLLLFIIFHVANINTCEFQFNQQVIQQFIEYGTAINKASIYKATVVKKAIRKLVAANLVVSVQRMSYMLNPLILTSPKTKRWALINSYVQILLRKGKVVDASFLPKYDKK
jgi:hypothetical protein